MTFCEIEAFGSPHAPKNLTALDINLALGKNTWQTSTHAAYTSNLAVDGNFNPVLGSGSCAMMNPAALRNWYGVLLFNYFIVFYFRIFNYQLLHYYKIYLQVASEIYNLPFQVGS